MELDVSRALAQPGQEFPFSGTQAIADQEIYGTVVRIDDCAVEGTFMADDVGNISVKGRVETVAHAPCANCQRRVKTNSMRSLSGTAIPRMMRSSPTKVTKSPWKSWSCLTPSWLCRSASFAGRIVRALNIRTGRILLRKQEFSTRLRG